VRNAREHGVEVRAVDVNHSTWDCALEELRIAENSAVQSLQSTIQDSRFALRLGFRMLLGLARSAVGRIEEARASGMFRSLADFACRTGLSQAVLERLAAADAFRSLGFDRRQALWHVLDQDGRSKDQPLFAELEPPELAPPGLPQMEEEEHVYADYQTAGLTLRAHPLSFYRHELDTFDIVPAEKLRTWPHNRPVSVAGLVLVRQRPSTAKGITFVTLEDETGTSNLVIHPHIWQRFYKAARTASALAAHGRLERKDEVIHVVVERLDDLTEKLRNPPGRSRDFR
jgi:error-prone DNA polymerase